MIRKTSISLVFALIALFFALQSQNALSFGHPDVIAPIVTINTDASIPKKLSADFSVNYTITDTYGSISECRLHTSDNEGINWVDRGLLTSCEVNSEATISSSWCPTEGTAICGARISASDSAGNSDFHEKFFTRDGEPPALELSSNRSNPTEKTDVTFTFWAQDLYSTPFYLANNAMECNLDEGGWQHCTSPKLYSGLSDGFHTFAVRAADRAGNVSPVKSMAWEIDSTPPQTIEAFSHDIPTYFSLITTWNSPYEDRTNPQSAVSSQYDIRYSAYPINPNIQNDWNNKTIVIKNESTPSSPAGASESMPIGPVSYNENYIELLDSYLPHNFMIKSRDEKWNWSDDSSIEITTKRDPCDYDADRIFSPKSGCGPNICDPDVQTCDLYDDPFDWGLAGDWTRDKPQDYAPAGEPWIKHFSNTTEDLDEDVESVASGRTGLPAGSGISESDFSPLRGRDWYDNPFTPDLAVLSAAPTLKQLKNTINDLDLDAFVSKEWRGVFGGKQNADTSDKVPINADIILDENGKNIAGCVYPEALEARCDDCTAYRPDEATGRTPPGKIQPSTVRGKAVCQIEAYYEDISGTAVPYEIIPLIGEPKGTLDSDRPIVSSSANCRDGVDNDLDRQIDTSDDIATRDVECPQEFGASQTLFQGGQTPLRGSDPPEKTNSQTASLLGEQNQAAIFPSVGLVQCGRYADDFTTPVDESADCGFCHFSFLINNILNLIIGRIMPILVVLSFVLGGFLILISRGNIEQVLKGRKAIQWSVMAYIATLLGWVLLNAFFSIFGVVSWTGFMPTRGEITELRPTSIVIADRDWAIDRWAGYPVEIQPPSDSSADLVIRKIISNTADTLVLLDSQPFSNETGYRYHILGTGWWSFTCGLGISGLGADFEATPQSGTVDFTDSFTVDFTDLSSGNIKSWLWDFGDEATSTEKSPRHTYMTNGPHLATLTITGREGGTSTRKEQINYAPTADFFVPVPERHGRTPWTVNFKDTSTGDVTSWMWDFGDGETSNEQSPTHTYTDTGPYVVKLKVSGLAGHDTKTEINYIFAYPTYEEPNAEFSYSTIPGTLRVATTNKSLAEDQNSFLVKPFIVYPADKDPYPEYEIAVNEYLYAMQRWYTNIIGKKFILSPLQVVTSSRDYLNMRCGDAPSQECENDPSMVVEEWGQYMNEAINGENDWEERNVALIFGAGGGGYSSGNQYDNHTGFVIVGDWVLEPLSGQANEWGISCFYADWQCAGGAPEGAPAHELGHAFGLSHPDPDEYPNGSIMIWHGDYPDTAFLPHEIEFLKNSPFLKSSTLDEITNWLWEFQNNDTGAIETTSVKEPEYSFKTNKSGHTIKLKALGPGGENKVSETVIFPPQASFTATPQNGNLDSNGNFSVNFMDTSTGTVSGWKWDFENNGVWDSTAQNPTRTYSANAKYTVKLEVSNPLGETSTKIISDYIVVAPGAYITADNTNGFAPLNVSIQNRSRCLGSCSWSWRFGDGETSAAEEPVSHTYKNEKYELMLTAIDSDGRSHRSSPITIKSFPRAQFSLTNPEGTNFRGRSSGTVNVHDQSETQGHFETWALNFGDGTVLTSPGDGQYSHTYNRPGEYTIELELTGPPDDSLDSADPIGLDFSPIASVSARGPVDRSAHTGTVRFDASGSSPGPGLGGTTYSWSGCASGGGNSASCSSGCEETKTAEITVSNAGGSDFASASYSWNCPIPGCPDECADNFNPSRDEDDPDLCEYNTPGCGDPAADNFDACVEPTGPQPENNEELCVYSPPPQDATNTPPAALIIENLKALISNLKSLK